MFVNFAREQSDDTDHDSDLESSSGGSSSGKDSVVKDPNFHKSLIGGTYAYMNPEYASGSVDTFESAGSVGPGALAFDNQAYDNEMFSTKL